MYKSVMSSVAEFFWYLGILISLMVSRIAGDRTWTCVCSHFANGHTHAACVQKPRETVVVFAVLFSSIYIKFPLFNVLLFSSVMVFRPLSSIHTRTSFGWGLVFLLLLLFVRPPRTLIKKKNVHYMHLYDVPIIHLRISNIVYACSKGLFGVLLWFRCLRYILGVNVQ